MSSEKTRQWQHKLGSYIKMENSIPFQQLKKEKEVNVLVNNHQREKVVIQEIREEIKEVMKEAMNEIKKCRKDI